MAEIDFDVTKYKLYAQDVKKYTNEVNILINNFYKRIQEIPTKTGEWAGASADKFVKLIVPEINECNAFIDSLYSFGNLMEDLADKMSSLEKNNKVGGDTK